MLKVLKIILSKIHQDAELSAIVEVFCYNQQMK